MLADLICISLLLQTDQWQLAPLTLGFHCLVTPYMHGVWKFHALCFQRSLLTCPLSKFRLYFRMMKRHVRPETPWQPFTGCYFSHRIVGSVVFPCVTLSLATPQTGREKGPTFSSGYLRQQPGLLRVRSTDVLSLCCSDLSPAGADYPQHMLLEGRAGHKSALSPVCRGPY